MRYLDLRVCAAVAATAAGAPCLAQQDADIERCRAEATMEERVACLEDVVGALKGSQDGAPAAAPDAAATPPPMPAPAAAPAVAEPVPAAAPAVASPPPVSVTSRAAPSAAPPPPPAATSHAAPPEPAPPTADPPRGIGADQVIARREGPRALEAREPPEQAHIVAHEIHGYAQLEVTLDNGQVWRQLQGDTRRVRLRGDEPIAVTIRPSRFGGYRMEIAEPHLEIQVERIR